MCSSGRKNAQYSLKGSQKLQESRFLCLQGSRFLCLLPMLDNIFFSLAIFFPLKCNLLLKSTYNQMQSVLIRLSQESVSVRKPIPYGKLCSLEKLTWLQSFCGKLHFLCRWNLYAKTVISTDSFLKNESPDKEENYRAHRQQQWNIIALLMKRTKRKNSGRPRIKLDGL